MGKASRAIIIEGNKLLVMFRNKQGSTYYTLVGGRINEGETFEQGLVREIREETGLEVIRGKHVYTELHPEPYNEQYIYLCETAPHNDIKIQEYSEEGFMNKIGVNVHIPMWVDVKSFATLRFRTPQLQKAIVEGLKAFRLKPLSYKFTDE